jgi:hypothetical protein
MVVDNLPDCVLKEALLMTATTGLSETARQHVTNTTDQ